MAEGGEMTRSVIGSSDVIYDFSCTPCAEDGKNTEAVTFCVNCDIYFCKTCVIHHNKVFKSHSQLDKTAMKNVGQKQKQPKTAVQLPNRECDEHPGNVIQMYCGSHYVVCCTVCIAMEHRSCNGIEFIPKLAKGILKSAERKEAKTALEKIRSEGLQLKSQKMKELNHLKKTKEDILEETAKLKSKILEKVNEMETKSTEEVHARYEEIVKEINNDLDSLNTMLMSTETQIKGIDDNQSKETDIFFAVKGSQKLESNFKVLLQQLKDHTTETLTFEYNDYVKHYLDKVETFGTIQTTYDRSTPYSATLVGEYNIKVYDDIDLCYVYDVCILDNNEYMISDYLNDKIKKLDKTFSVTDACKMSRPWGICTTKPNELAVTLCDSGKVQFVKIDTKLECSSSFSTDLPCRGIKCNNDTLIIACGLRGNPGEVRFYSLSGSVLRRYARNNLTGRTLFTTITHLLLSLDDSQIFICDTEIGLVILDSQGNIQTVMNHQKLKTAFGVCKGDRNEVFLCGNDSYNVFELDGPGVRMHEVLSRSHGICQPLSVTFVTNPKRLIVTRRDSDKIKVFKLT